MFAAWYGIRKTANPYSVEETAATAEVIATDGTATVYRMVNTLEEIGAISRRNMYRITCDHGCDSRYACTIEFEDDSVLELFACKRNQIIQAGLAACGYPNRHKVRNVIEHSCE